MNRLYDFWPFYARAVVQKCVSCVILRYIALSPGFRRIRSDIPCRLRGLATCGAFSPVPAGRALARKEGQKLRFVFT